MTKETEYRKALVTLTKAVIEFENAIESAMKMPSTAERGKKIAELMNWLTTKNQSAMRFTLGYSWAKIMKLQKVTP